MSGKDWNPETYEAFADLRLRPALDLLAQVPKLPAGGVVDLGCGNGQVGPALKARFAHRFLIGIDSSPAMLARANETGAYDALAEADALAWIPEHPPALIFSNALCHWLPDHPALFARLSRLLVPGGVLAVQMPRQELAPSHALLRKLAFEMFPDRFNFSRWQVAVSPPADYFRMLAPLGQALVWETTYLQRLAPMAKGHPVRHFTQSTAMRPFLDKLDETEAARFTQAYDRALATPYSPEKDGSVLFPFRRVFFALSRTGRGGA